MFTGELPGYLSPSAGLKYADIPDGLDVISAAAIKSSCTAVGPY